MQDLAIIGAGYVGLVTAVGLAGPGRSVTVVEIEQRRLASLERGVVPIHEAGLQDAFTAAVNGRHLRVLGGIPEAPADLVFVCVGTPISDEGEADLSALDSSLAALRAHVHRGAVIVIRSTLPLGTTTRLVDRLGLSAARTLTNPEFLRQGTALADFRNPSRIVIGTSPSPDPAAVASVREAFASFGAPVLIVGYEDAEAIKNASNAFLGVKLAFANEIAALCEAYGADAETVLEAVGRDPRIGHQFLRPSFGFGGSCLPKELQNLSGSGLARGVEMHVSSAATASNTAGQDRFADRILGLLAAIGGSRVALLGLAFKAHTDDLRSSPAMHVARKLLADGVSVAAYDPAAAGHAAEEVPALDIHESAADAIRDADVVAVTTEWPEFAALDWPALVETMRSRVVVDGRRLLDPAVFERLGVHYERIGSLAPPIAMALRR